MNKIGFFYRDLKEKRVLPLPRVYVYTHLLVLQIFASSRIRVISFALKILKDGADRVCSIRLIEFETYDFYLLFVFSGDNDYMYLTTSREQRDYSSWAQQVGVSLVNIPFFPLFACFAIRKKRFLLPGRLLIVVR